MSSLPQSWVDRIFDKLTLTYGQQFLRRWADLDINAVKSDWGHELAGFESHPDAISWALQNLPGDHPPTVLEFRALARKSPPKELPRLEAPKADPDRVAAEVAKLAPVLKPKGDDGKEWARRLVSRASAGDKVRTISLRFAREALGMNP
jgi:hypothetical protein